MSSPPEHFPSASPAETAPADRGRVASPLDPENFKAGARWRGVYQMGEQLPDVTYGKVMKALHVSLMADVTVRSFRVRDGERAQVWESIKRAQNGDLLELVDAVEFEGRRVEVTQAPPAVTLREWVGRKKPEQAEIFLIARQLTDTVGSLHRHGIVHLNLRPDLIYVRTTDAGLNVVVGGFETAHLLEGSLSPIEVTMDPFYGPPEALGLHHYAREPGLRAWDWWSLGRVLQEVVLGRHILGHILERDVARETPELRARAENLLKEENHMVRAGAVEMMPAMDRETNTLLRGLLTGSRDGRWGLVEVESWLRKEPVKERYNLPKNEQLFVWKDRAYTVTEAAEYFSQTRHWHEGLENLFEPTNVATLAYFLGKEGAHRKTKERLELMLKLGDASSLQQLPPETSRDIIAAIILKFLAGHTQPLVLRGRRVDEVYLRELLAPEMQPSGLATVYGLTARPIVQQIEPLDAELGRMLEEIGRIFESASTIAEQNHWLSANDAIQLANLMRLSMEAEISLGIVRSKMAELYACSRDPVLDHLFKKKDASHAELVVIVFTNLEVARFGYVTHRQWNEEQHRVLREYGQRLSTAGTWLRLGHALKIGLLVFGRFRIIVPVWLLIAAAVALVWQNGPAYLVAGAFPLAVFFVRLFWHGVHREKLKRHVQEERPWRLRSGGWHCREEAARVLGAETVPGPGAVLKLLQQTNEQIAKLVLDPAPGPVPLPLRFRDTQVVSLASWLIFSGVIGVTVWQGVRHPPKLPDIDFSVVTRLFASKTKGSEPSKSDKVKIALEQVPSGGLKSMKTALEELRRSKREADPAETKMSWPFKSPQEAQPVRVIETAIASPEQDEIGQEMGLLLLDRYKPETIKDLVAVQVPVEKGVGLMLFNGRIGKLAGKKIYVIGFLPISRAWLDLDSNKVIFLNSR